MSVNIPTFWKLLQESRLLAPEQCQQLAGDFLHVKGADQGNANALAQWLVSRNVLSDYQTKILLAGRPGPFYYGEYKVYDRVERGKLAGCFRAVHAPTGHPVLLHFLTGPIITDPQLWATAANDVLAACAIGSPHTERFFEPVDLQSFKFLVTEDLRGSTLDERLSVGRFPPAEACRVMRLAAIGLAQMHQCGRVHGDVRPANILLENIPNHPGNVKLLFDAHQPPGPIDFTQQQPGSRLAAMADYLAPELMSPGRVPDPLADIYALGCTLYTMLSGNPPFPGGNIHQKMTRHATEAIRPLEQLGIPQPLAQLVAYLMAKNPAVRYQSAAIVAEQLSVFIDPNVLYAQPPAPLPTLPNYESFIRQKHAQLAGQYGHAAQAGPQIATGITAVTAVAPAGSSPMPGGGAGFQTDRDRLGAMANAAADGVAVPGSGPAIITPGSRRADVPMSAAEAQRKKEAKQKQNLILGLVGAGALAIAALVGINMMGGDPQPKENEVAENPEGIGEDPTLLQPIERPEVALPEVGKPPIKNGNNPPVAVPVEPGPGTPPVKPVVVDAGFQQEVVPDDGQLLWASPTAGKPVAFNCVPPVANVFMIVRPADMIASGEGGRVLAALGPTFAANRTAWEMAAGVKLEEVDQLIIGLHNNDAKFPRTSFVVKTKAPASRDDLLAKWGNPAAAQEGSATYYNGPAYSYYISTAADTPNTFLMGQAIDVKEVAKVGGAPPQTFRDVERLRRATDGDRHFTLIFYPPFLFNDDGEPLFAGEFAKTRQPISWLLGDSLQAASISMHFTGETYLEMRMLGSLDKEPFKLASELRDRMNQIPSGLEDYFVLLTPPQYWKKLSFRYPSMINTLHANMRVGVESEQAIINAVLPPSAAHNLVLGGELLISSAPGAAVAVAGPQTPAATSGPKTLAEAVNQVKTTYTFDQQSLELSMAAFANDVKDATKNAPFQFTINIIGKDLQLDGITKNQSIRDFKQQDKTVAEILTALVMKANPITTVKDPSEADQKLIWVIGPDPDNPGKEAVLITTRAAAATKKYTLPAPFLPKNA